MKCLKEANPDRIETENRLLVARSWGWKNGEWLLRGMGFLSGVIKMFKLRHWVVFANLWSTELYTSSRVNFIVCGSLNKANTKI